VIFPPLLCIPVHILTLLKTTGLGYSITAVLTNLSYVMIPLVGWLSDTKIGRGNAIYISLWFGWIGTLLQAVSCCLQYSLCGSLTSWKVWIIRFGSGVLDHLIVIYVCQYTSICNGSTVGSFQF
jgi:dipeptide/tripeptide permease